MANIDAGSDGEWLRWSDDALTSATGDDRDRAGDATVSEILSILEKAVHEILFYRNVYGADGARPSAAFAIVGDSRSPPYRSPLTDVTDDAYMRERAVTIAAAGEAAPPPVRTAIVTGGTSGVGREVVRGLRQAGLALVLVARDGERGRAVCDEERLCTPAVLLTSELPPLEYRLHRLEGLGSGAAAGATDAREGEPTGWGSALELRCREQARGEAQRVHKLRAMLLKAVESLGQESWEQCFARVEGRLDYVAFGRAISLALGAGRPDDESAAAMFALVDPNATGVVRETPFWAYIAEARLDPALRRPGVSFG